ALDDRASRVLASEPRRSVRPLGREPRWVLRASSDHAQREHLATLRHALDRRRTRGRVCHGPRNRRDSPRWIAGRSHVTGGDAERGLPRYRPALVALGDERRGDPLSVDGWEERGASGIARASWPHTRRRARQRAGGRWAE